MKNRRFQDHQEDRFTISEPSIDDPILVVCPKCSSKAIVIPHNVDGVRAVCSECGYANDKPSDNRTFYWHDQDPTDGYFGFNLWLKIDCLGNSLWAFNKEHLKLLELYISAELRENNKGLGWRNSSVASRFPKWIKSSKNREALLKAINKLKENI